MSHLDEKSSGMDPSTHCFREDNCVLHPDHDGPGCCCCGADASDHAGCDCEDE